MQGLTNPDKYVIFKISSLLNFKEKSGEERRLNMLFLIETIVSILADVAAYYICKWIDRHDK